MDLDLDLDLDIPNQLNDNIDNIKNINKINKPEQDKLLNEDLNIKDLVRLINFNDTDKIHDNPNNPNKNLDLVNIVGKKKKLSFTKYMNDMRIEYDKQLFNPEIIGKKKYEYGRDCQANQMKQPYIVTKQYIESYNDPDAFNGYIKYRGNYYICPRIWDFKANTPISVKKFIENGLKSPYTGGIALQPDQRKLIELDNKHTVIIRKPTTGSIWEVHNKHPEWPTILKKTEKEAYPYLMSPPDHPQKMCVPCCGAKKPDDYDHNKHEIQQIFKPQGDKICRQKLLEEQTQNKSQFNNELNKLPVKINYYYLIIEFDFLEIMTGDYLIIYLNLLVINQYDIVLNQRFR